MPARTSTTSSAAHGMRKSVPRVNLTFGIGLVAENQVFFRYNHVFLRGACVLNPMVGQASRVRELDD